ncbi:17767_t:CDS:10 [Funneliformis caledonium]|uniref:17767_t:CDS:1 n=1 Tax=Funneliformis caledonium TaxID=1117310 RepID=A0A9N8YR97_9GLOM|nr:17767_t:CDS:10 [Funneliformis caledonium]
MSNKLAYCKTNTTPTLTPSIQSFRPNHYTMDSMEIAITHYEALKKFLAKHLARARRRSSKQTSRTNAREKLTRLTKQQFQELSTDVYDELTRRLLDTNEVPFLPVKDEFHPKRNQARQKLATLPPNRFKDLASDVYYELERRYPELKDMIFSTTNNPSSKQNPQQSKLSSDEVKSQASKANNIVPEISTLKQETISGFHIQKPSSRPETPNVNNNSDQKPSVAKYGSPRSPRSRTQSSAASSVSDFGRRYANGMSVSSLSSVSSKNTQNRDTVNSQKSNKVDTVNFASIDSLMADLGDMIDYKKSNGSASSSPKIPQGSSFGQPASYAEVEKVKADYELQVATLQKRIKELEIELSTKSKSGSSGNDSAKISELERKLEEQKQINKKQISKMSELEREFDKLTEDHHQQQEVANDVQKEATGLLEEIKELSRRNDELYADKERDAIKIKDLTIELNEWKNKYDKTRTELRNLKEAPKVDILKNNSLAPTSDGAIDELKIINYQVAIDDLLRAGRSDAPTNVLMAMKSIVIISKSITEEVEYYEQSKGASIKTEDKSSIYSSKLKLSSTLANLMSAAKNHATGYGVSPVSLLDAAASHLTTALVDLVKLVKLRREGKPNAGFKVPTEPMPISNHGLQNEINSVENQENGSKAMGLDQLKGYLEGQTEEIVSAIHSLLKTIRSEYCEGSDLTNNIDTITKIVVKVIQECQDSFKSPAVESYKERSEVILKELEDNVDKLEEMKDLITRDSQDFMSNKISKQRLASASFEIAKFTKELVGLVRNDE